jgi:hypothetical protein
MVAVGKKQRAVGIWATFFMLHAFNYKLVAASKL